MIWVASLFLMSLVVIGDAHLCMISPHQRGSMNGINKPGAPDCKLLDKPCGGRAKGQSSIAIMRGKSFVVTWQKNLDHFNSAQPGQFRISIGKHESNLTSLYQTADTSDPSLFLYSANITVPEMLGEVVIQSSYLTSNPQAPPVFYQCADVIII